MDKVKVFASATVANVGCAFDILGFAVEQPGDTVIAKKTNEKGIKISKITGDNGKLPLNPEENSATVSALAYMVQQKVDFGVDIEIHKNMPLGSGMGSSSASSVAGVFAVNLLNNSALPNEQLLPFCMEGERAACGSAHADNVAPCLIGDFVLIRSTNPLDIIKIKSPDNLYCTLVNPDVEVRTSDARMILRKDLLLKDAVIQWGNIAGLISGLYTSNYELIGRSLQDVIIEPERSLLIPGFHKVKDIALKSGALGCTLSGSGPSMFAFSTDVNSANFIAENMISEFKKIGIESKSYISKINSGGPSYEIL